MTSSFEIPPGFQSTKHFVKNAKTKQNEYNMVFRSYIEKVNDKQI